MQDLASTILSVAVNMFWCKCYTKVQSLLRLHRRPVNIGARWLYCTAHINIHRRGTVNWL